MLESPEAVNIPVWFKIRNIYPFNLPLSLPHDYLCNLSSSHTPRTLCAALSSYWILHNPHRHIRVPQSLDLVQSRISQLGSSSGSISSAEAAAVYDGLPLPYTPTMADFADIERASGPPWAQQGRQQQAWEPGLDWDGEPISTGIPELAAGVEGAISDSSTTVSAGPAPGCVSYSNQIQSFDSFYHFPSDKEHPQQRTNSVTEPSGIKMDPRDAIGKNTNLEQSMVKSSNTPTKSDLNTLPLESPPAVTAAVASAVTTAPSPSPSTATATADGGGPMQRLSMSKFQQQMSGEWNKKVLRREKYSPLRPNPLPSTSSDLGSAPPLASAMPYGTSNTATGSTRAPQNSFDAGRSTGGEGSLAGSGDPPHSPSRQPVVTAPLWAHQFSPTPTEPTASTASTASITPSSATKVGLSQADSSIGQDQKTSSRFQQQLSGQWNQQILQRTAAGASLDRRGGDKGSGVGRGGDWDVPEEISAYDTISTATGAAAPVAAVATYTAVASTNNSTTAGPFEADSSLNSGGGAMVLLQELDRDYLALRQRFLSYVAQQEQELQALKQLQEQQQTLSEANEMEV